MCCVKYNKANSGSTCLDVPKQVATMDSETTGKLGSEEDSAQMREEVCMKAEHCPVRCMHLASQIFHHSVHVHK